MCKRIVNYFKLLFSLPVMRSAAIQEPKTTPVETIPFRRNEKGELLDRISGQPITRLPLF